MPTDSERRKVAKRLLGLDSDDWSCHAQELEAIYTAVECNYGHRHQSQELHERLADLIDPDDAQSRDVTKTVDRDALLALADEMGEMPQCDICPVTTSCTEYADGCAGAMLRHYARRIRKACGEEGR